MTTDLSFLSDAELQAEMNRRTELAAKRAKEARERRFNLVLTNKEVLLEMMSHTRRSCVEGQGVNKHDCMKCRLFDLSEYDTDVDVFVEVHLNR